MVVIISALEPLRQSLSPSLNRGQGSSNLETSALETSAIPLITRSQISSWLCIYQTSIRLSPTNSEISGPRHNLGVSLGFLTNLALSLCLSIFSHAPVSVPGMDTSRQHVNALERCCTSSLCHRQKTPQGTQTPPVPHLTPRFTFVMAVVLAMPIV